MHLKKRQGLKPYLIKFMALLIGFCYLLNPVQQQVNTFLHSLSHELAAPSSILSHKNATDSEFEVHQNTEHHISDLEHKHLLIDLMSTIFQASSENDHSNESNLIDVKWDKHIVVQSFNLSNPPEKIKITSFSPSANQLVDGHPKKFEEPPKRILS